MSYFVALAEEAESHLMRQDMDLWLDKLEQERDNLRAALQWTKQEDVASGTRLVSALSRFWYNRGPYHEGILWLEWALAQALSEDNRALRVNMLSGLANLLGDTGEMRRAYNLEIEALAICRSLGNNAQVAGLLSNLAITLTELGEYEQATEFHLEALAFRRYFGNLIGVGMSLNGLGEIARSKKEYQKAITYFEESVETHREFGAKSHLLKTVENLALTLIHVGEYKRAQSLLIESLQHGSAHFRGNFLLGFASLARAMGKWDRAVRLLGACDKANAIAGAVFWSTERADYDEVVAATRSTLGDDAWQAGWEEGRGMSVEEAIAYALKEEER